VEIVIVSGRPASFESAATCRTIRQSSVGTCLMITLILCLELQNYGCPRVR